MNEKFQSVILTSTEADSYYEIEVIQDLWSGYGQILRLGLKGSKRNSVVVKHVRLPKNDRHPRGWNTDLSHNRKVKSYEVETAFYRLWSARCNEKCRIPDCLAYASEENEVLIVLEDLDASGYSGRRSTVTIAEMEACLKWLANFHATFMQENPTLLWEIGTYWHLDTRPDELDVLDDRALKKAAGIIDERLQQSPFQTFVHGDAKLANFCFSEDGKNVAAVDFQYIGGGCGMKDVAYFIGSCLYENDCEKYESYLLEVYFKELRIALKEQEKDIDTQLLEEDWRKMFPLAWTDFHRFIKGWSPGHWRINSYSEKIARKVISQLQVAQ